MADRDATVRALILGGLTYSEAVEHLTAAGVESPGGPGKPWHKSQIGRIMEGAKPRPPRVDPGPPNLETSAPEIERPALPEDAPLIDHLRAYRRAMDTTAKEARVAGSWTAVVAAQKAAADLAREIESLRPVAVDPITEMTDDELREIIDAPPALRAVG